MDPESPFAHFPACFKDLQRVFKDTNDVIPSIIGSVGWEILTSFIGPRFLLPSSDPLLCVTPLRANTDPGGSAMFTVGFHLPVETMGGPTPTLACLSRLPGNPLN